MTFIIIVTYSESGIDDNNIAIVWDQEMICFNGLLDREEDEDESMLMATASAV